VTGKENREANHFSAFECGEEGGGRAGNVSAKEGWVSFTWIDGFEDSFGLSSELNSTGSDSNHCCIILLAGG
jgi:hypothetical protein